MLPPILRSVDQGSAKAEERPRPPRCSAQPSGRRGWHPAARARVRVRVRIDATRLDVRGPRSTGELGAVSLFPRLDNTVTVLWGRLGQAPGVLSKWMDAVSLFPGPYDTVTVLWGRPRSGFQARHAATL